MANEVQRMTVGVELQLTNFTAQLDALQRALSGIANVELIPSKRLKKAQDDLKKLQEEASKLAKPVEAITPVGADATKNINAATQALKKLKAEYTDTALVAKATNTKLASSVSSEGMLAALKDVQLPQLKKQIESLWKTIPSKGDIVTEKQFNQLDKLHHGIAQITADLQGKKLDWANSGMHVGGKAFAGNFADTASNLFNNWIDKNMSSTDKAVQSFIKKWENDVGKFSQKEQEELRKMGESLIASKKITPFELTGYNNVEGDMPFLGKLKSSFAITKAMPEAIIKASEDVKKYNQLLADAKTKNLEAAASAERVATSMRGYADTLGGLGKFRNKRDFESMRDYLNSYIKQLQEAKAKGADLLRNPLEGMSFTDWNKQVEQRVATYNAAIDKANAAKLKAQDEADAKAAEKAMQAEMQKQKMLDELKRKNSERKQTVDKTAQETAKAQQQITQQTVTDEKLRQAVVNQTKLLLTELRKIVAALGEASKKATGEATQSYEQQGKVIADLTAKIGELAKTAVQAEQTKQTAVNQTTKAYESQQAMYERLQKNIATAPNEAAYNANQQGMRKAYNYLATNNMNTPVSEYMTTPYRQAIYSQVQSALQGKEFQKLLALAPTDKRARFDERAERWTKAVDSLTDIMPATVAALKSATWNPYANKDGYFENYNATYARKPRKGVAEEEAGIRAALASLEYNRKENVKAREAARKAYEDAYYNTGVGAGVKANREGQRAYSSHEVEKMLADMPAHVQARVQAHREETKAIQEKTAAFEKWRAEANKASYKAWDAYEKELNKDYKDYIKALTPDKKTLKKDYANIYTPTADEKKAEKEAAKRVMLQNQAEEKAYEQSSKLSEKARKQKQVTLDRLEEAQQKYYDKIKGMQSDFQKFSEQGILKTTQQGRDLERRYNSIVNGMTKIADMANKLDPTWRYADNPDISTRAGRINNLVDLARSGQQFTPEYRLESNRAARQSMLDKWDYFGNDQGFSAQISQLRQLKEAAWLDYKQGGAIGDPAMMEKSLKQLSQAKTIEQQLVKYMEEYNRVLGTTETVWGKFTRKLHSHLNWITAGATLGLLFAVPTEAINSIVKTDEAMHNLGTVMRSLESSTQAGKQDIAALTAEYQQLNNAAIKYGATNEEMIESARLWGRMYKDVGMVNALTSQSAKLAVADNFSVQESTKAVEAAMFQFGLVARSAGESLAYSNEIVDVYTKLSHNAGASAQDLARGVERSGAAAHLAGMDFEFLTSLIAAGTRATALSGQEIGNMMKTLVGSYRDKKSVAEFEKLGITIKEIGDDGVEHFKPLQEILMDVSVTAATTDQDLQKLYKAISGGKFQWNKAANTLKDYKEIIKNWGLAVDSQGFTDEQVKTQMDSITRRMAKFKADLEGIWITGTNGGLTESLKEAISALDGLLKLLNGIPHEIYSAAASFAKFVLAAKLAATVARIYSEQMLALKVSTEASTNATEKDTTVKDINSAANEKNAGSAKVAAASTKSLAGAMTAGATAGKLFSGAIGMVGAAIKRIPQALAVMLVFEAISRVIGALSDYDEAADKARQSAADEYAAHEQAIMMGEKRVKFVDALLKAHGQLTAALAETNENSEKYKEIQEDIKVTEQELTNVLGKEAVERMKQDGWTEESKKLVRDTYVRTIDDQKKKAKEMMMAEYNRALQTAEYAKAMIELYDKEAAAFIDGNNEKIKSLDFLRRAQVAFNDWMLGNAEDFLEKAQKKRDEAMADYQQAVADNDPRQDYYFKVWQDADRTLSQAYTTYNKQKAKDEKARNDAFYDTFHYNNDENKADLAAAMQILGSITNPEDVLPVKTKLQNEVGDGDGDDNKFQKQLPNISQPNLSLIPQAESAKISAIKADLDALVKNTSEDLERINQSIEMYGANDYTTEATRDVYLKQAKAYNDAADKLMEVNKSIRADLGAQLNGTAPIKANDMAQYASSAAGIRAAGVAANNYAEHEDWIGNVTSSPNIQCDSWTGDVYANAGIESIGGEATRNGTINSDNFKAAGAFHVLGDGYKPQPGDLISLDRSATSGHYGIVIDENTVRSRDSSHYDGAGNLVGGGVKTWNLQDWIDTFSGQGEIGFGSIAEATGSESAKFAQQFEVSNRSIEEAYNSAKETQGVWANLSKEERLAWADAHKDEIAEAKNYITLTKTMDSLEKEVADKRAKAAKAEYEAYKSVATNYEKQVAQAKQNVEYRNQQELANLGLGATDTDKARMAQETARAELAERQRLLTHKDSNGEVMLKKGTEIYKKWAYEIQKAQVALDESTEKLIEAQYNNSKDDYERLAKARDLAMGDMSDGMNWFNRYGEAHFNALQDAEAEVERLKKKLDSLREDTVTKDKKAIEETQNALTEAMQKAEKVRKEFSQKINDGLYDIFDQLLFEGGSIEDILKDLWKGLGKDALKILMHQDIGEGSFLTQLLGIFKTEKPKPNNPAPILSDYKFDRASLNSQFGYNKNWLQDTMNSLLPVPTLDAISQWDKERITRVGEDATAAQQTNAQLSVMENNGAKLLDIKQQSVSNTDRIVNAIQGQNGATDMLTGEVSSANATVPATTPTQFTPLTQQFGGAQTLLNTITPQLNNVSNSLTNVGTQLLDNSTKLQQNTGALSEKYSFDKSKYTFDAQSLRSTQQLTNATISNTGSTNKNVDSTNKNVSALAGIGGMLAGLFGDSDGGRIAGGILNAVGMLVGAGVFKDGGRMGSIAKYADGGQPAGKITGAGTGRSDSILAYLANKGKFVMLSNGEYVINEKSAKAIGYDTLDRLNRYAIGGSFTPTPYVPTLNQKVVDRTLTNYGSGNNGLYRQNGSSLALMEQQNKMMAEQNDMLKNAGSQQGASQIIVLNTHASSDDVMRALQENPRIVQNILGRQQRMGFR